MGNSSSSAMSSDVGVLQKQLAVKNKVVQELQTQLADKMRGMDDFEDELERKDRTIYYLERDMSFRSRNLGVIRRKNSTLEQRAAKQNFGNGIDEMQARVDKQIDYLQAIKDAAEEAKRSRDHLRALQGSYENIIRKLDQNTQAPDMVELLQAELNTLAQTKSTQRQFLADIKAALDEQTTSFETLKGQARYLEQYRMDSIFRVFSLKGQARMLIHDLQEKVRQQSK